MAAIGGYGRRQLYPASDVDLLALHEGGPGGETERVIAAVLQDLWDLGLRVGQQVWSWAEIQKLDAENFEFATALLDARFVCGDADLAARLLDDFFPRFMAARHQEVRDRVLEAWRERRRQYRDTIFQLEPDVKLSPGGLRDYLVARWLTRIEDAAAFVPYSTEELEAAHDFMSRLRVWLHFVHGRDRNVLTHALQEKAAAHVGFGGGSARSAVESLMKEYFIHARRIDRFCRKIVQASSPQKVKRLEARQVGLLKDMTDILGLFIESIRRGQPLAESAELAVVKALHRPSGLSFPALAEKILELFCPRAGLYDALEEMYELGVLETLFPEFGTIKARVIRDFYHRYTVDEHSLQAIKAIEELARSEELGDSRFRSLLEEAENSEILVLTLLLHDVGKGRGGKHVDTGARMAAKALKRFRFDKARIDTVIFLIRNHLAMSATAFRRNIEDREEVRRFADLVQNTENLRLLCLLTYADVKAVAPNTLNEWKRERLWQLYLAAYNELTLRFGDERIEDEDIGEKLLARLPGDLDAEGFEDFLEGFPLRYLTATPPKEIYEHYRLGKQLSEADPVQQRLNRRKTHHELCVVTADRYGLFSKIAGLLTYFEMNILRGYGFANRRNVVLDFFQFSDTRDTFRLNPGEKKNFESLLRSVIEGEVSVEDLLARKENSLVFQPERSGFEAAVFFVEDAGKEYSVAEIVAPDSLGLLYRISREISEMGCNIELALISTEGDKAVDVFYLTRGGGKLDAAGRRELTRRIKESIGSKT